MTMARLQFSKGRKHGYWSLVVLMSKYPGSLSFG